MANSLQKFSGAAMFAAVAVAPFVAIGMGEREPGWWVCDRQAQPQPVTVACVGPRPAVLPYGPTSADAARPAPAAAHGALTYVGEVAPVAAFPMGRLIVRFDRQS